MWLLSHSIISINSGVVVPKLWICLSASLPAIPFNTQAITVRLCTSRPAQHSCSTFMVVRLV
jgi:hypothetical protein